MLSRYRQYFLSLIHIFLNQFDLTPADIIDRVYRKPFPNRFLASLSPFLAQNLGEPCVRALVLLSLIHILLKDGEQCNLHIVKMKGWKRKMDYTQTGLQWGRASALAAVICEFPARKPAYSTPTAIPAGMLCKVTASTIIVVRPVSYTHRDVYKRQEIPKHQEQDKEAEQNRQIIKTKNSRREVTANETPVSYTHLDVYKRQP